MRERDVEAYLRERVRKAGGTAYKFESPGTAGVPDRLVVFPGGRVQFVELKAPGAKPTALQEAQIRRLRVLGCTVDVLDSKDAVDAWMGEQGVKPDETYRHDG